MSEKQPELLSPERLAEIEEDSAVAIYWVQGQRYPTEDMGQRAVPAVYELLADREAFRQQVAAELAGLLTLPSYGYLQGRTSDPQDDNTSSYDDESRHVAAADYQDLITAAATRLGIALP